MTKTSRQNTFFPEGIKVPCVVSTDADIVLSGEQTIGVTDVTTGDRVIVRSQSDNTENGIYDVDSSAWTRSVDFSDSEDVKSGVGMLDIANGVVYFANFSGTYNPGTTVMSIAQQDATAPVGAIPLSGGTLSGASTVKTFTGNVTIFGDRPGTWNTDGVQFDDADYVRFPKYANKAALDAAFLAAGVTAEVSMMVYSEANDMHVYYNDVNWVQIDDDTTVML